MRPTYLFPAAVIEAIAPDRYEHPDPRVQEWMEILCSRAKTSRTGISAPFRRGYTHRVAISNSRLVRCEGGRVTFEYKDYAEASKTKVMTLEGVEFLRRWVQHVLPRGFVKIRHYGLLANRHR